jgi:hypothetical protein
LPRSGDSKKAFIGEDDAFVPPLASGSDHRSTTSSCSTAASSMEKPRLHRHHLNTGIKPRSTRVDSKSRKRKT